MELIINKSITLFHLLNCSNSLPTFAHVYASNDCMEILFKDFCAFHRKIAVTRSKFCVYSQDVGVAMNK